jgi:hypothetical protein
MATYINATTQKNRVKLLIIKKSSAGDTVTLSDFYSAHDNLGGFTATTTTLPIELSGLQDVTINNSNGSFRWKQLDLSGESVVTTNATNSLSGNFVLDTEDFWGVTGSTAGTAKLDGIFKLSNQRTEIAFLIAPSGIVDGEKVLMGTGFISALAPTVSADSPVWVSPITIEVNGDFDDELVIA